MIADVHNTPKHVTDTEIVLMFRYGRLSVRKAKAKHPEILSRGKPLKASIVEGKRNPRWRIKVWLNGKQRTIVLAKAVWLGCKGLVPPGFELHHIDEDRMNDSIDNLELLTDDSHSDFHYGNSEPDDF